jgi:hypothetical protein
MNPQRGMTKIVPANPGIKGQIEVWTRRCLWVPADAINFKPALCPTGLPNAATVGSGWAMGFATDNGDQCRLSIASTAAA